MLLIIRIVLADHERSSDTTTPKTLNACTLSTHLPVEKRARTVTHFLQIPVLTLTVFLIPSLWADSSPPVINPMTVVLSANLIMMLDKWTGMQS